MKDEAKGKKRKSCIELQADIAKIRRVHAVEKPQSEPPRYVDAKGGVMQCRIQREPDPPMPAQPLLPGIMEVFAEGGALSDVAKEHPTIKSVKRAHQAHVP